MQSTVSTHLAWLCVITISLAVYPAWLQKPPKRKVVGGNAKAVGCCEEVRELKMQVANLTALIEELSKKQEDEMGNAIVQMMEMEGSLKQMDLRLNDVEGKYSEMNNQLGIVQLQAAQTVTQTSAGKEVKLPPPAYTHTHCCQGAANKCRWEKCSHWLCLPWGQFWHRDFLWWVKLLKLQLWKS